jgi:hypothetical protein
MGSFDFEYSVAILIAVLVALGKIVPLLFATVRLCVQEYDNFRVWLRETRKGIDRPEA